MVFNLFITVMKGNLNAIKTHSGAVHYTIVLLLWITYWACSLWLCAGAYVANGWSFLVIRSSALNIGPRMQSCTETLRSPS